MDKVGSALLATIGGLVWASPACADPSAGERVAVAEAELRGTEMYDYDQAAWHATDSFRADLERSGGGTDGLAGYVVEPSGDGQLLTTFYGDRKGVRLAFATYWVSGNQVVRGGIVPPDGASGLSLVATRMISAREVAIRAASKGDHGLCSGSPPNTLVLPPRTDGTIPVYLLTSTTDAATYPAGGHSRFDIGADGKLSNERRFMKSCFPLNFAPRGDSRPAGVFLTHLLDAQPTEVHVFVSLNIPVTLMVGTVSNRQIWAVNHGKVRYVGPIPDR